MKPGGFLRCPLGMRICVLGIVLALAACTRQTESDKVVANKPAVALPQPTISPRSKALLAWPVAPLSKDQIADVKKCDVEKRAAKLYPKSVDLKQLPDAVRLKDICDQATLAQACAERLDGADPPKPCVAAYSAAVKTNPAFAFAAGLPGGYFGKVDLVDAPPGATHPLVSAVIEYDWTGMGDAVSWTLTIKNANNTPTISATGATLHPKANVDKELSDLRSAVTSFLPIPAPLEAVDCYDNYPVWTATLEYEGGEKLELATHRSNLLSIGGPWQLTAGGVTYLQLGPQLAKAMAGLVKALDLPLGEPMGTMCHGYDLEAHILE